MSIRVDANIIKGFMGSILAEHLDEPKPTPKFHEDLWELLCSENKLVAAAAPRGHGKSTAGAFAYVLAMILFRSRRFVVLVSATEGLAVEHLRNIKRALSSNITLIETFGIEEFEKDTESDIVVRFKDGHRFRIIAKGSEQKVRGMLWESKRPDLIFCDDMEDDVQVSNDNVRDKFRRWFFNALLPCLGPSGIIRIVGTILHFDSLLERLLQDKNWKSFRFRAHDEYYENVLWPERVSLEDLMAIKSTYHSQGNPEGYSQEYLNYPIDVQTAYFRKSDLRPMKESDYDVRKEYYVSADLAISKAAGAAYTALIVAGTDDEGMLYVVDVIRGRYDSLEIMTELFTLQKRYKPQLFVIESEKIQKALGPILNQEMLKRGLFMNLHLVTPTKDKESRARGIQARMRSGGVKFDKEAEWWDDFETEVLRFPKGAYSDQVDALAWLGLTLDKVLEAKTDDEVEDEEYDAEFGYDYTGMSAICGY